MPRWGLCVELVGGKVIGMRGHGMWAWGAGERWMGEGGCIAWTVVVLQLVRTPNWREYVVKGCLIIA